MENYRNTQLKTILIELDYNMLADIAIGSNKKLQLSLINIALQLAIKQSRGDLIAEIYYKLMN